MQKGDTVMCEKKRISVDLDADIHKKLKIIAVEKDTTITELVANLVMEKILNEEKDNVKKE